MLKYLSTAAIAGASLLATPALAQDAEDWTGFYAGGQLGYGFQPNDDRETILFDTNLDGTFGDTVRTAAGTNAFSPGFCGGAANTNAPAGGCRDDRDGIEGGVHIGYDMQVPNSRFVLGLVADYNRTRLRDSVSGFTTTPASYTMTRELRDLFTFRGRVGFAAGRTLFFATSGIAYGKVRNSFATTNTANSFTGNGNENGFGFAVGGGVEQRLGSNFSIGAQYLYRGVDADDYVVRAGPGTAGPTNAFRIVNTNGTDFSRGGERLKSHAVQLTASYRF